MLTFNFLNERKNLWQRKKKAFILTVDKCYRIKGTVPILMNNVPACSPICSQNVMNSLYNNLKGILTNHTIWRTQT
jgi:hypothetical protein